MTFRNRCTLPGANGAITLSIPLDGGRNQRRPIKEVKILGSEKWQLRHWKTIESVYNKSPWFEQYRDELSRLYLRNCEWLVDWNMACFEWITDKMAIKTKWSLSGKYVEKAEVSNAVDWRNHLQPSTINTLYPDTIRYPQVFQERTGFVPNVSILDYLFCAGNWLPEQLKER